jgi:HSP20 family protein
MKEDRKKGNMEVALMTSQTVNPFQMMRRFSRNMERLFEDFGGLSFPNFFSTDFPPFRTELDNIEWVPQIEVLHNNGQFMVRADLPGLTKDDVKVELTDDLMTISGERKKEKEEKRDGFYRSERSYGSFYRQIPLPEGAKTENAAATFHDGVLEVTIHAPKVKPSIRNLEINAATNPKAAKAAG